MIARLTGTVVEKEADRLVLDVGGVGYLATVPLGTMGRVGEPGSEVSLYIHTHVREDTLSLFGFLTGLEKEIFERLITISGVGPRLAVTVLSGLSPEALAAAVRQGDLKSIQAVPGVGKKTAERMVLELRDKLDGLGLAEGQGDHPETEPLIDEAGQLAADTISALENLGYPTSRAREAVRRYLAGQTSRARKQLDLEGLLRGALGRLNH
jgi:Holliday junction DNA helicase RuvA